MADHADAQRPKDFFIADFKQLPEKKRAAFADKFIDRLFGSGFGVLNKKEIELAVLSLMEESGALKKRTNNELSLALGISETRVRNILYAARLRYGVDEESYLRDRLPELLTQMSPELITKDGVERVRFVVEDGLLQQAFNARVKAKQGVPDKELNEEICQVSLDKFTEVVASLVPSEIQDQLKQKFKKNWEAKLGELIKKTVKAASEEGFKTLVAKGTVPALTMAWSFASPHTAWLAELIKTIGSAL